MHPLLENNKLIINFNPNSVPEKIGFETEKALSTFEFCNNFIVKFIRSLVPSKLHSHNRISIRMLKLCATSISKPLQILYENWFANECFPQTWEMPTLFLFIEKVKSSWEKTIDLSSY